jgi:hypothetical protein
MPDRGLSFHDVRISRSATGALIDAGHSTIADLQYDLATVLVLHGVGPAAASRLEAAGARDS